MKKFVAALLAFIMAFGCTIPAFAKEPTSSISEDKILKLPYCPAGETMKVPVGDAEYIDDGSGNLIKISDLQSFDSQQDVDRYIDEMICSISSTTQYNPTIDINARATHGDVLVASQFVVSSVTASINLRVAFTTSGNGNTGRITYHQAYTTFTGFTLGFGWDERICSSQIISPGKDLYVMAAGDLTYNLLIDGFIELGRETVNLSGYCYCVR